eukprot:TRINITY_DN8614_c0_g1_i3.p1 TRINITY_DN8614_c0_g1~~TRINITY_DN8614_c0_g1_i3.p1  ORF type:complete len:232 (+),score=88.89 TRINITY_DN8614_c0_g1_i3:1020-1715(+)
MLEGNYEDSSSDDNMEDESDDNVHYVYEEMEESEQTDEEGDEQSDYYEEDYMEIAPASFYQSNNNEEKEGEEEDEVDYLLIMTTTNKIYLYDTLKKKKVAGLGRVFKSHAHNIHFSSMNRISILDYIPEYSLLLAASQGAAYVVLISLIKNSNNGEYLLRPVNMIPDIPRPAPISGAHLERRPSQLPDRFDYFIHILYLDKKLYSYSLKFVTEEVDPTYNYLKSVYIQAIS